MSKGEEGDKEIPLRVTNTELAKIVNEKMGESRAIRAENRAMRRELDMLKGTFIQKMRTF